MSSESTHDQIEFHQTEDISMEVPLTKAITELRLKPLLITWVAALGIDFLWHGGLLAEIYTHPHPALLNPIDAFIRIPLGYFALLVQIVLLYWLFSFVRIKEWRNGLKFGLMFGILSAIASVLGQYSILTLDLNLLILWGIGQVFEFVTIGTVLGAELSTPRPKNLGLEVGAFVVISVLFALVLQNTVL